MREQVEQWLRTPDGRAWLIDQFEQHCAEDCPRRPLDEDTARYFGAEAAWLRQCITRAVQLAENEQGAKHDLSASIPANFVNYALAPHIYLKPSTWDTEIADADRYTPLDGIAEILRGEP